MTALTCSVCIQIHAQTPAGTNGGTDWVWTLAQQKMAEENLPGNTNEQSKIFPIGNIRDGWRLEDAQYYYRHGHGDNISEILPAPQDPTGNWGEPTDGLQLSLRFRRHEYLPKEQVVAVIIARNLGLPTRRASGDERDYQFTLQFGTNTIVWKQPEPEYISNVSDPLILKAKMEGVNLVWLNQLFDLSQLGKYALQVQTTVLASDGKGMTNLVSGTATFEIVKKLSPAAIADRNAQAEELNAARNGKIATNDIPYK